MGKEVNHVLERVWPHLCQAVVFLTTTWQWLMERNGLDALNAFFGFLCLFYGSEFVNVIIAIESFRVIGWEKTRDAFGTLWSQYQAALKVLEQVQEQGEEEGAKEKVYEEREERGERGEGEGLRYRGKGGEAGDVIKANVSAHEEEKEKDESHLRIDSTNALLAHVVLFFQSVDPAAIGEAAAVLHAAVLAIIAALKVKVAQDLALALSISDVVAQLSIQHASPIFRILLNEPYHRWIDPSLTFAAKCVSVFFALLLRQVNGLFQAALRGSDLFVRGTIGFLVKQGYIAPIAEDSPHVTFFTMGLSFLGIVSQLYYGSSPSFPMSPLIFPLVIVDSFLFMIAAF